MELADHPLQSLVVKGQVIEAISLGVIAAIPREGRVHWLVITAVMPGDDVLDRHRPERLAIQGDHELAIAVNAAPHPNRLAAELPWNKTGISLDDT